MKPNPHTFTTGHALLLAVFAVLGPAAAVLSAQEDAAATQTAKPKAAEAIARPDLNASEILDQVRGTFESASGIACELKQTVFVGGRKLVATGEYAQATGNRMRLDYRVYAITAMTQQDVTDLALDAPEPKPEPKPAADAKAEQPKTDDETSEENAIEEPPPGPGGLPQTGRMIQVNDGSVLWTHWENNGGRLLTRRNVQDILTASEGLEGFGESRSLRDLGVGGMQTLMASLQNGMEFGGVQEQTIGGKAFLILVGRWNQTTRTDIFGIKPEQADNHDIVFPESIPDYVRIYVQKDSMLPRRVQYLKRFPSQQTSQVRPMSTLDLLKVRSVEEFESGTFEFQVPKGSDPADVRDQTEQVIETMKRVARAREQQRKAELKANAQTPADPPAATGDDK